MHATLNHAKRALILFSFAVIIILTCMSGAAAAQSNGDFQVDTISVSQNSIDEGDPVTINYTIKNFGSSGTKDIILEDNEGEVINRTRQNISNGATFNRTVQWGNTPERPQKKAFPTVRTPDDVDSKEIKIRWSEFQIIDFTAEGIEPVNGKNVKLDYTIQNIGSERSSANITVENDKENTIRPKSKTPPIGPEETYSSSPIRIEQIRGEYTYDLTVENTDTNDTTSQSVSVELPNTGAVTIDRSYYNRQDGEIKIEATIENQADFDVKQNVSFLVNGSLEKTLSPIELDSGESEPVQFSHPLNPSSVANITVQTDAPDAESTEVTAANRAINPRITKITPSSVTGGEDVSITYTGVFDPAAETATLSIIGPDGEVISESEVPSGSDVGQNQEVVSVTIPDDPGLIDDQYDVRLDAEDTVGRTTTAIKKDAITVTTEINPDAVGAIGESVYRAPAGGFVEVSTDGEYMLIGGDTSSDGSSSKYLDILHVEEGSTIINTRLIGTNRSSEQAYGEGVTSYAHRLGADAEPDGVFQDVSFQGASTLAELRENVGIGPRSTPLQTGRYRLLAGANGQVIVEDGAPTFASPVGRSNLVLTQPQLEAVNTYVLPPAPANEEDVAGPSEDATESNTIAAGERLLIELQATGIYGAMIDDPTVDSVAADDVSGLLKNEAGVEMDLSTRYYDGAENNEADLRFEGVSSGDLYVLPDKTTDQWADESSIGENTEIGGLYVVVDTRGEAFSDPSYGDVMQFETRYESPAGERFLYQDVKQNKQPHPFTSAVPPTDGVGHFPYFGDSDTTVTVNSTIEYMEPSIQYGRTTVDGELIVPSESDGQILGSTTMAPGTEATIQFIDQSRSDPELVTIEEVTIEEDRTFTASADFSALDSGDRVAVEFYTAGRLPDNRVVDRRGARVVDDVDNIANYQITNLTTPVAVQQRSSLDAIEATINNTGELTGQQVVRFSIDGEPIRNESLRLSGNSNASISLSEQFVTLPVGAYEYTVQTDNDEQTGELRVTEPDSGTTITNEENSTPTASSPLDESDAPDENDESDAPDENDENTDPNGIFGLVGVSGRDVALGAALTGTAHVLGYWT